MEDTDGARAPQRGRLPLRRPQEGRVVAGVCAGLAAHLALPVERVRLLAVALGLAGGVGVAYYLWLWATVPAGDPVEVAAAARPAAHSRVAPRLRRPGSRWPASEVALGLVLLLTAGLLLAWRLDLALWLAWAVPALILLAGAALAWSQLDEVEREEGVTDAGASEPRRGIPPLAVRIGLGLVLAVLGVLLLLGQGQPAGTVLRVAAAGLAVLLGVGLVLTPLWLRLVRSLGAERAARAREAERADIAAHLHDSVLQTLALIRARAADGEAVAALARAQERELRGWLYADRAASEDSLAAAIRSLAAEVEDRHGIPVDVVTVGDRAAGPGVEALLGATREALVNAARHGGPPVSLYVETGPDGVEVFVRDRGAGFELDGVPPDRLGVRESILGRMRRSGGEATIRAAAGAGTEVRLRASTAMLEPARVAAAAARVAASAVGDRAAGRPV